MKKRIAILGSTGSIGTQALKIVKEFPDKFELNLISANSNDKLLLNQAVEFQPNDVVINSEEGYKNIKKNIRGNLIYSSWRRLSLSVN